MSSCCNIFVIANFFVSLELVFLVTVFVGQFVTEVNMIVITISIIQMVLTIWELFAICQKEDISLIVLSALKWIWIAAFVMLM